MDATELVMRMLDMLFGSWVSSAFGYTSADDATMSALAYLLSYGNVIAMMFASIVITLFSFGGTVNGATKGAVLSQQWSGSGTIISTAVAAALILPLNFSMFSNESRFNGQVSLAQGLVLQLTEWASDFTNTAYLGTIDFFSQGGLSSSFSMGNVEASMATTRAHACTIAGLDPWDTDLGSEGDIGTTARTIDEFKPYNNRYVAHFAVDDGTGGLNRGYETFEDLRPLLQSVNQSQVSVSSYQRAANASGVETVVQRGYLSHITFGGPDGVCGKVSFPQSSYGFELLPNDATGPAGALDVDRKNLSINAHRELREAIADLVEDSYYNARSLIAFSLIKGDNPSTYFANAIANMPDLPADERESLIEVLAYIHDTGGNFYRSVATIPSQLVVFSDESIIKEAMSEKGWIGAPSWALETSRITAVVSEAQEKSLSFWSTKGNDGVCLDVRPLYQRIYEALPMVDKSDERCDALKFISESWDAYQTESINRFASGDFSSGGSPSVSPDATYYLMRSAKAKKRCPVGEVCDQTAFEGEFYISDLLVDWIWEDPSQRGIENPPEPISYAASVGNRMLNTAAIVKMLSIPVKATAIQVGKDNSLLTGWLSSLLEATIGPVVFMIDVVISTLAVSGYLLSYVLPMIPVLHWIMYVFSWMITVVLAYAVIPLSIAMITIPTEQGFQSVKKQRVVQVAASVFLKPFFGLAGLFAAIALAQVGLGLFNSLYWDALAINSYGEASQGVIGFVDILRPFAIFLIATSTIIGLLRHSFSVMIKLPEEGLKLLDWFSDRVFGDEFERENWSQAEGQVGGFGKAFTLGKA